MYKPDKLKIRFAIKYNIVQPMYHVNATKSYKIISELQSDTDQYDQCPF